MGTFGGHVGPPLSDERIHNVSGALLPTRQQVGVRALRDRRARVAQPSGNLEGRDARPDPMGRRRVAQGVPGHLVNVHDRGAGERYPVWSVPAALADVRVQLLDPRDLLGSRLLEAQAALGDPQACDVSDWAAMLTRAAAFIF